MLKTNETSRHISYKIYSNSEEGSLNAFLKKSRPSLTRPLTDQDLVDKMIKNLYKANEGNLMALDSIDKNLEEYRTTIGLETRCLSAYENSGQWTGTKELMEDRIFCQNITEDGLLKIADIIDGHGATSKSPVFIADRIKELFLKEFPEKLKEIYLEINDSTASCLKKAMFSASCLY